MKKYRPQLFFAAAVVIGLITSLLAMGWLRNAELRHVAEAAMPVATTTEVVVAKADLAWGTKLTPEMLQVVNYPAGALPDGYYKSVEDWKDAVLLNDLKANEVILRSKLAPATNSTPRSRSRCLNSSSWRATRWCPAT